MPNLLSRSLHALRTRGVGGFLKAVGDRLWYLKPNRYIKRLQDRIWDLRHGVDTAAIVDLRQLRIPDPTHYVRYQSSTAKTFHEAIGNLPIRYEDFTFIDWGCGKGKCLLLACEYPFRRILGLDLSAELLAIARRNAARYRGGKPAAGRIETVQANATEFVPPPVNTVHYFYNPFDDTIFRTVLSNISKQVRNALADSYIVYCNPHYSAVFEEFPSLSRVAASAGYHCYRAGL